MNTTDLTPRPELVAQGDQLVAEALQLAEAVFGLCTRYRVHAADVALDAPAGRTHDERDANLTRWAEVARSSAVDDIVFAMQCYCSELVTGSESRPDPQLPSGLRRTFGGVS